MELCMCSQCCLLSFTNKDGKLVQGHLVTRRTHLNHAKKDIPSPILFQNSSSFYQEATYPSLLASESSESSSPLISPNDFSDTVSIFLAWLHLACGISGKKTQIARSFIVDIICTAQQPENQHLDHQSIPRDIRTILKKLEILPELRTAVCCPTCFYLYHPPEVPKICSYKEAPKARPCGCPLFVPSSKFRSGVDKRITPQIPSHGNNHQQAIPQEPSSVFVTQPFKHWLGWFLKNNDIEKSISAWTSKLEFSTPSEVYDIQQGNAWKKMKWPSDVNSKNPLRLVFSLFIDWFNPHGNKLAGKQKSIGVISMNCLNLPPDIRNSIDLTYVAGLTPGPNAPSVTTINHILKTVTDDLLGLELGHLINTQSYPQGREVFVQMLPLLGDVVGVHKVAGFASHSARYFCSWCKCQKDNLNQLKLSVPRTKEETLAASLAWKNSTTLSKREALVKESGVRWSELNRLGYRNPVEDNPLGLMHNWLEGILQHHFRVRWGFGSQEVNPQKRKRGQEDHDNQRKRLRKSNDDICENEEEEEDEDDIDECDGASSDGNSNVWGLDGLLTVEQIDEFKKVQAEVVLPTGLERPPHPFGEQRAGKWKAHHWYTLFQFIVPVVLPQIFAKNPPALKVKSTSFLLLTNVGALCRCTSVVCARTLTPQDPDIFRVYYERYTSTSKRLFKDPNIRPNHHYALHIPEQLELWGPLHGVAEFAGERLIGFLQKIKTNTIIREMDRTMMKNVCALQRLKVGEKLENFGRSSDVKNDKRAKTNIVLIPAEDYKLILSKMKFEDHNLRDFRSMPHPEGSNVLLNCAKQLYTTTWEPKTGLGKLVSVTKPNNGVVYRILGKVKYGLVHKIYKLDMGVGTFEEVILVNPITEHYEDQVDSHCNTFRSILSLFRVTLGKIHFHESFVIRPSELITLFAYTLLSPGTFLVPFSGILLRPVDHTTLLV